MVNLSFGSWIHIWLSKSLKWLSSLIFTKNDEFLLNCFKFWYWMGNSVFLLPVSISCACFCKCWRINKFTFFLLSMKNICFIFQLKGLKLFFSKGTSCWGCSYCFWFGLIGLHLVSLWKIADCWPSHDLLCIEASFFQLNSADIVSHPLSAAIVVVLLVVWGSIDSLALSDWP